MDSASRKIVGACGWAVEALARMGRHPHHEMDQWVAQWWEWYSASADFYSRPDTGMRGASVERVRSLHPCRMAAEEMACLVMDENTVLSSPDKAANDWLAERLPDFVPRSADDVAMAYALGTGAWSVGFTGIVGESTSGAVAVVDFHDAGATLPLVTDRDGCVSCAFASRVSVAGREYDQLQVHEPDPATGGTYHVRTWLYDPRDHRAPVRVDEVVPDLDTGSVLPTFALVRPAIANQFVDATPLGVSVFHDAIDVAAFVDEAFDSMAWSSRACKTRIVADERAIVRDPATGEARPSASVDARVYETLSNGAGESTPIIVYNPDLRAEEHERQLNGALSLFSIMCGFGPNYFSYSRQAGLRTATEVVADNSQLVRNVHRHEQAMGESLSRLCAGAYAAETALRTGSPSYVPFEVKWDDTVVEDTATERANMRDDIARGLCPAWLYPMRYYGMSEADAKALVGWAVTASYGEE